jgi:hypothetical protein
MAPVLTACGSDTIMLPNLRQAVIGYYWSKGHFLDSNRPPIFQGSGPNGHNLE